MVEKCFQYCSQLYIPPVEDANLKQHPEGAAMAENYVRRRLQLYNSTVLPGLPVGEQASNKQKRQRALSALACLFHTVLCQFSYHTNQENHKVSNEER